MASALEVLAWRSSQATNLFARSCRARCDVEQGVRKMWTFEVSIDDRLRIHFRVRVPVA
ncbi:MAG: hypothetical protein M2R45_02440 [Verrucomicrobia subdivision 3 bacterium]|nr:hypothetical protein [Limisphaerales bacterium]MCS1416355.1 hypothetical protein [Limisphaerales bacterium]